MPDEKALDTIGPSRSLAQADEDRATPGDLGRVATPSEAVDVVEGYGIVSPQDAYRTFMRRAAAAGITAAPDRGAIARPETRLLQDTRGERDQPTTTPSDISAQAGRLGLASLEIETGAGPTAGDRSAGSSFHGLPEGTPTEALDHVGEEIAPGSSAIAEDPVAPDAGTGPPVVERVETALVAPSPSLGSIAARVEPPKGPVWVRIRDMPTIGKDTAAAVARSMLSGIPCFSSLDRKMTDEGLDLVGAVRVIAKLQGTDLCGGGIDAVGRWIQENGTPVAAGALRCPEILPGYEPRIAVALSEDATFLMVMDEKDRGAPHDAVYVYAWPGGRRFYEATPAEIPRLRSRLSMSVAGVRDDSSLPPPRRPRRRGGEAPIAPPTVLRIARDPVERRPAKDLPQAKSSSNLSTEARRNGFSPRRDEDGPVLVRERDGGLDVLQPAEGAPIAKAGSFVAWRDTVGFPRMELGIVTDVDEIEAAFRSPAPNSLPTP